ncbi:hypothetical protein UA08_06202 [Talaromyces atroroseus]|uniref:Enoyl reductase (ER) domain-containing protein n=1 Tax=Talaromyces atroroseus TaxID=1441469 RepID=A0A225AYK5_TALAT|nr:hypothetical protein UA08_06202 [Talaromyces atroroseus]OKL58577.1 hypothetical protein UA08_06202 [Talaromyces atroroseus]
MVQNKALVYKKLPSGTPVVGEHLAIEALDFDLSQPIPDGGLLVRGLYFSLDPYMRGRMRDPLTTSSYVPAFPLDKPMVAYGLVQVIKSANPKYAAGSIVFGIFEIAEYSVAAVPARFELPIGQTIDSKEFVAAAAAGGSKKVNGVELSYYLSVLGMTGLTAYSSLYEIGQPKKGETIFISSAAGAVGQIVGQIAKREGLRVIGSVGDDAKLAFIVNELGFDAGWNYKKGETPLEALKRLAPEGVDIYYDNVGGEQLDAALQTMNVGGRIVVCGMISQYNLPADQKYPIKTLGALVSKRVRMQGFLVNDPDFGPKYLKERNERISEWLAEGSIVCKEDVSYGIDSAPTAFVDMLAGKNFGKAVVKVADPE